MKADRQHLILRIIFFILGTITLLVAEVELRNMDHQSANDVWLSTQEYDLYYNK